MSYEEAESDRVGGEGDSSRAHGIPDGTGHDQLHGPRPNDVLRGIPSNRPNDILRGIPSNRPDDVLRGIQSNRPYDVLRDIPSNRPDDVLRGIPSNRTDSIGCQPYFVTCYMLHLSVVRKKMPASLERERAVFHYTKQIIYS